MRNNEYIFKIYQYLSVHPIINYKNYKIRLIYFLLLKRIIEDVFNEQDKNIESMLKLFKEKLFINYTESIENQYNKSIYKVLFKVLKSHYKYILLLDCLFISAFDNIEDGFKILNRTINIHYFDKKKMKKVFNLFYKINFKIIKKEFFYLYKVYKIIYINRKFLLQKEKRIIITANMSTGKSTLLNALIGKTVSKTQNDSCTSKIHYIYNKAGEDGLMTELDYELNFNATKEILMENNIANNLFEIKVGTRFRTLFNIDKQICFIDTPGVNSALNTAHREISTNSILCENYDILLYILNGENIGTNDDINHLKFVYKNCKKEIIFLVNKVDAFKKGVDSVSETINIIKKDLLEIGFSKPKIYPISAYAGYLAKKKIFGEKLNEDENDSLELFKRKLSKEEFRFDKYFNNNIDEYSDEYKNILKNSGILSLEKLIY